LAEVYQANRIIDTKGREPWFVVFETTRPLSLLDVTGEWTTKVGASAAIATGPKARARRWSISFYDAFTGIDGILYLSSMGGNAPAFALYERSVDAFPPAPTFHRSLADPNLVRALSSSANSIGYKLL
jgi:hypothetical protein